MLGELDGGRDEAAAARARRQACGTLLLLRARVPAHHQQVPGRRVGPAGVRGDLRAGRLRRPPGGAQHARGAGVGVPVVDHGRRALNVRMLRARARAATEVSNAAKNTKGTRKQNKKTNVV
jgi:hypothetical protein